MFEPIKIALHKPVKHGQRVIDELVFGREMVAEDMFGLPPSRRDMTMADFAAIAAKLTEMELPVIKLLSVRDFRRVTEVVGAFLMDGLEMETEPSESSPGPSNGLQVNSPD